VEKERVATCLSFGLATNAILSEKVPNRQVDPVFFDIVTRNMIHGACGKLNIRSSRIKNGKCTIQFPKSVIDET